MGYQLPIFNFGDWNWAQSYLEKLYNYHLFSFLLQCLSFVMGSQDGSSQVLIL